MEVSELTQSGRTPDRVTRVHDSDTFTGPICLGLRGGSQERRAFVRSLLIAHGYRVPRPQPSVESNELFHLVLVLGGLASITECERLQDALAVPVLVVSSIGSASGSRCTQLEFPCRFLELEQQIASALGRKPPKRPDIDPRLGVIPQLVKNVLPRKQRDVFQVLLDHDGLPVPDATLCEDGFGAKVVDPRARDKRVWALGQNLRCIGLDVERNGMNGWFLVWS